tara:strand:+ start:1521 stop:1895 length:375 start_codon:yes stop_codon:yes gene_type:complete
MIANAIIFTFLGFFARGIYNKYFVSKWEQAAFREIELNCLYLMMMTYEDFVYLKQKKEMMMHKMGVHENEIKMTKNIDDQNIENWKKTAINKFLLALPPRFRQIVKYRNWKGAMIFLNAFKKNA